ncbi:hypothetical protein OAO55_01340 [Bacteroidales bacterium]|nr:hypothetical protein [Bacteroidales bacterium]
MNINKLDFLQDVVLIRASIRSLEVIGEASKKKPKDNTQINIPTFLGKNLPKREIN